MRLAVALGIDLGTARLLVFRRDRGIVVDEASLAAVAEDSGRTLLVGTGVEPMLLGTPANIRIVRPIKEGVISDYAASVRLLQHAIDRACGVRRLFKPGVLISVPSSITSVERRAVLQAATEAGAGSAMTIERPLAAAIGAGLPFAAPGGNMVVDFGAGTTDIGVVSLGGLVLSSGLRFGGGRLDEAIMRHARNAHGLAIGEIAAEEIKIKVGSAWPMPRELTMEVRGMDLASGAPKSLSVSSDEIREAMMEPLLQMVERICRTLEQFPPELAGDVIDRGIVMTGGGALLRGLDKLVHSKTDIRIRIADSPQSCVAVGAGRGLEDLDLMRTGGALTGSLN